MVTPRDIPELTVFDEARFWSRCDVRRAAECWPWRRSVDTSGYGRIGIGSSFYAVHRVAYVLVHGQIPKGLILDHLCRNRRCVNPRHLEIVDTRTNVARGVAITALGAQRRLEGFCTRGHVLAEVGFHRTGTGDRLTCAECGRERARRYRLKRAALLAAANAAEATA